jgi:hypothetical protein
LPGHTGREQTRPSTSTTVCSAPISPGYPEEHRGALETARSRYEREGVPASEPRHCDAEHPSGTRLPGCLKVYIPDFTGAWRIVFQIAEWHTLLSAPVSAASTNSLITDCMPPGHVGHHDDVT